VFLSQSVEVGVADNDDDYAEAETEAEEDKHSVLFAYQVWWRSVVEETFFPVRRSRSKLSK
jgi:hypothetical protein